MENPYEVLAQKEMEVLRLRRETEALRLVIDLLEDETEPGESSRAALRAPSPLLCFRSEGEEQNLP